MPMHSEPAGERTHTHDAKVHVHELAYGLFMAHSVLEQALVSSEVFDPEDLDEHDDLRTAGIKPTHSLLPPALQRRANQLANDLAQLQMDVRDLPVDASDDTLLIHDVVDTSED